MRVTSSMMVRSTLRDLSQGLSRLQETQTKLATGKDAPPTVVRVRGKQTGARMLGLPVVEVSQADRVP